MQAHTHTHVATEIHNESQCLATIGKAHKITLCNIENNLSLPFICIQDNKVRRTNIKKKNLYFNIASYNNAAMKVFLLHYTEKQFIFSSWLLAVDQTSNKLGDFLSRYVTDCFSRCGTTRGVCQILAAVLMWTSCWTPPKTAVTGRH